jgi:hypothetical protein
VAAIEHVPGPTNVTVAPDTVQTVGVGEAKLTGRPEDAVAAIANGGAPTATLGREPKVIICVPWLTVKLFVTEGAAA